MDKKTKAGKRPPIAQRALSGVRDAGAYLRGGKSGAVLHRPVNVAAIRAKTGLTQPAFAARYGIAIGTLRDWEQGRAAPERMAQTLLRVIERAPEVVEEAVKESA